MLTLTLMRLHRDANALARDSHLMHRTLLSVTGGVRPLWCLPNNSTLIIQHDMPLADMPVGLVVNSSSAQVRVDYDQGERVSITLIGAPVASSGEWVRDDKGEPTGRKRRSYRMIPPVEQPNWLVRQLSDALTLEDIRVEPMRPSKGLKAERTITWSRVAFAARGIVADPDRLRTRIIEGVGHGRAFGLGLLMVTS